MWIFLILIHNLNDMLKKIFFSLEICLFHRLHVRHDDVTHCASNRELFLLLAVIRECVCSFPGKPFCLGWGEGGDVTWVTPYEILLLVD